jgi:hypothetical protein
MPQELVDPDLILLPRYSTRLLEIDKFILDLGQIDKNNNLEIDTVKKVHNKNDNRKLIKNYII